MIIIVVVVVVITVVGGVVVVVTIRYKNLAKYNKNIEIMCWYHHTVLVLVPAGTSTLLLPVLPYIL